MEEALVKRTAWDTISLIGKGGICFFVAHFLIALFSNKGPKRHAIYAGPAGTIPRDEHGTPKVTKAALSSMHEVKFVENHEMVQRYDLDYILFPSKNLIWKPSLKRDEYWVGAMSGVRCG